MTNNVLNTRQYHYVMALFKYFNCEKSKSVPDGPLSKTVHPLCVVLHGQTSV